MRPWRSSTHCGPAGLGNGIWGSGSGEPFERKDVRDRDPSVGRYFLIEASDLEAKPREPGFHDPGEFDPPPWNPMVKPV